MKRKVTNIGDLKINGYEGEYIFENIEKTHDFYEADTLKKWSSLIKNPQVIFDIGANLGNHTLYWATKLSPKVIYSFEPLKANLECLQRNCDDNQLQERVVIVPEAVGGQKNIVQIKNYDESNLGSTSFEVQKSDDSVGIPLTTVDIFVQENQLERLDFVKIDTEGFECDVLAGMQQSIQRFHPAIWVEVSAETGEKVNQLLEQMGYFLADVIRANLLFLDKKLYSEVESYDFKQALYEMLYYLNRTNLYYENYVKMKGWNENNIAKNTQLSGQNQILKSQMEELNSQLTNKSNDLIQLNEDFKRQNEDWNIRYEQLEQLNEDFKRQNEDWQTRYDELEQNTKNLQEKINLLLEIQEKLLADKTYLEQEVERFAHLNREYAEALSDQVQS
ncbi:FkbM family methyltransferase, partial [Anaerotruncus colihominis]